MEEKPEPMQPIASSNAVQANEETEVKQNIEPMDTSEVSPNPTNLAPVQQKTSSAKSESSEDVEVPAAENRESTPPTETVKKESLELVKPNEAKKPVAKAPATPKTPKVAKGQMTMSSFFKKTPKAQEKPKEVKKEVADDDLEIIEAPKKAVADPGTPKSAPRSSARSKLSLKPTVKNEPEIEDTIEETATEEKKTLKVAQIGYFSSLEKLIDICKKFHGPHKVPLDNMKFDDGYKIEDEFIDETVEDIVSGEITEANFSGFTGMIAQKDYEKNKTPDKWDVLILKNQHLILAFRKLKTDSELISIAPDWVKKSALQITVELVGVPNNLFTTYSKKLEDHILLELQTAMSAVFFDEGKASEKLLASTIRKLADAKKTDSEKQWNSFKEQGVLQTRGSNIKYVILMCTAPAVLFNEYDIMLKRNKKSGSTCKIVDGALNTLVDKLFECRHDYEGFVELLKTINSEDPVLKPEQIIERINAFEAPKPAVAPPAKTTAPLPTSATPKEAEPPRKRKARSSGLKPQIKKERVDEDDSGESVKPNTPMSGSDAQVVSSDAGSEVKWEVAEAPGQEMAKQIPDVNSDSSSEVKSEFEIPDIDFDPTTLPDNVKLIQTPLTCAVFTQVEMENEENICIWTNDLDPDIITTAHLNADKCIVLAEKVETFEDEEVIDMMKKCKVETVDFTILQSDDNVLQWSFMCFGERAIPDGVKNKLFRNYRDVEKIVQKCFEADKKSCTSMVRFADDDLLPSLSKQLSNKVIGCNYIN